jgi:threonine dehydratase
MQIKVLKNRKFSKDSLFYKNALNVFKKIKRKIKPIKITSFNFNNTKIILANDTKQYLGSYKLRGATYEILRLNKKYDEICLGSTGNFGLSIGHLAKKQKIKCNIFVSKNTNSLKITNLKKNGSVIFDNNKNYDDAKNNARKFAKKNNIKFIDVCSQNIFLGNASYVLDIVNNLKKEILGKKILAIFPLGSGSLATPSIKILKYLNKKITILLVEPENFSKFYYNFDKKKKPSFNKSIAEGASVKKIPKLNIQFLKKTVDMTSKASEIEIKKAMKFLYKKFKIKSEGAGALALTPVLFSRKILNGFDCVIVPVCGSNISNKDFFNTIRNVKDPFF